jgi:hypothetical protein
MTGKTERLTKYILVSVEMRFVLTLKMLNNACVCHQVRTTIFYGKGQFVTFLLVTSYHHTLAQYFEYSSSDGALSSRV